MPPERQLAVAFGTARSTIRKALDQLEQKNLVVRRVGSGTFVNYQGPVQDAMADVTDLISPLQLIEARIAIEPYMTRLAALHASARDLDAIGSILLRIEALDDDQDLFTQLDSEFHLALARCSRNPLLYRLYQHINTVRAHAQWEQMKQIILSREKIDIYNQQHRAIFEALQHARSRQPPPISSPGISKRRGRTWSAPTASDRHESGPARIARGAVLGNARFPGRQRPAAPSVRSRSPPQ